MFACGDSPEYHNVQLCTRLQVILAAAVRSKCACELLALKDNKGKTCQELALELQKDGKMQEVSSNVHRQRQ